MKIKFFFTQICVFLLFAVFLSHEASAFGLTPSKLRIIGSAGETLTAQTQIRNTDTYFESYDLTPSSIKFEETGGRFLEPDDPEKPINSAQDWIALSDYQDIGLDPGEEKLITATIKIPSNATPGTYYASMLMSPHVAITAPSGSGIGITARIPQVIEITVEGIAEGSIVINNFEIDQNKLDKGLVQFNINLISEGTLALELAGNIKIFDKNGIQIAGIVRETENVNGETIVRSLSDTVGISEILPPSVTKTVSTNSKNLVLSPGDYTAELSAYYYLNTEQTTLSAPPVPFTLKQSVRIDSFSAPGFQSQLPISFNGEIINNTSDLLRGTAVIKIKNVLGIEKKEIKVAPDGFQIEPGGKFSLGENIAWDNDFAMGFYSADLLINYNDGVSELHESISFWILNWWQIIIAIAILSIVILAIYKGIHGYNEMKKRLAKAEKK